MNALSQLFIHSAPYFFAAPTSNDDIGCSSSTLVTAHNTTSHPSIYDPSSAYQGTTVVEVWIGQEPVTVGDVGRWELEHEVQSAIRTVCINNNGQCNTSSSRDNGLTGVTIEGASFKDTLTRDILIVIIARTVHATFMNKRQNCYWEKSIRFCIIGNLLRINMHEMVQFQGAFKCCDTLSRVEGAVDTFRASIEGVFGRYSRNVRCITEGSELCEARVAEDG
ncbi:hypothetical protein T440DRAFT_488633 [Plenodomus tracheiphilus IPT5]|uniref:Uncharacterized protein n=1 Tax=Plenodomus tracheiphilus IPT5 TaxID=1408161 RepID=A0A6A7B9F6_9PLEO|nr:hypothetical protein T440DRAFT_488633 [Plenodomus tracheiphilus IPT5]